MIETFHFFKGYDTPLLTYPVTAFTLEVAKEKAKERSTKYKHIGTFSEYYLIDSSHALDCNLAMMIKKDKYKLGKEFILKTAKTRKLGRASLYDSLGYHSSEFNNNTAFVLSKQDLLDIANSMEDADNLFISAPDTFDKSYFANKLCKVESK